jgi:hypothetical protein
MIERLVTIIIAMTSLLPVMALGNNGIPADLLFGQERKKLEFQESIQDYLQKQLNKSFPKGEIHVAAKVRWRVGELKDTSKSIRLENLEIEMPKAGSEPKSIVDSIHSIDVSLFFPNWVSDETIEAYRGQVYTFIPMVGKHKVNVWGFRNQKPPRTVRDFLEEPGLLRVIMEGALVFLLVLVLILWHLDKSTPARIIVKVPKPEKEKEKKTTSKSLVPIGNVVRVVQEDDDENQS